MDLGFEAALIPAVECGAHATVVFVTGSLFMVGEARALLAKMKCCRYAARSRARVR